MNRSVMSTLNGLPAHALLVHFIVVLAPLVAVLEILAGLFSSVRSRLVWLILALAAITTALTPITTSAGEWLEKRVGPSAALETHTGRGDWMIYISSALLVVALLLVVVHLRERRTDSTGLRVAVAIVAILVGVTAIVQVVRIGESGARAVWGDSVSQSSGG